jgi:hypothetical protein
MMRNIAVRNVVAVVQKSVRKVAACATHSGREKERRYSPPHVTCVTMSESLKRVESHFWHFILSTVIQ